MHSRLKRFLLLVMMLALPVQTFASAAMLGCAFSQSGMDALQEHGQSVMAAEPACHESGQSDPSPSQNACKHCSACYLVSALLVPSIDTPPVILTAQSLISHVDDVFIGYIPDSLDRPPRLTFA